MSENSPLLSLEEIAKTTTKFKVNDQILVRQIEDEAVLLHMSKGSYYSLNETSLPFWEALRDQVPLQTAIDKITSEYEVESTQVFLDLQVFLEQMIKDELITEIA